MRPSAPPRLLFACLFAAGGPAQTTVGGAISTDTRWTVAGSPYLAASDVIIFAGAKLTIDPGVDIQFASATRMVIGTGGSSGTLVARGTAAAPIRFTRGAAASWRGLRFTIDAVDATFDASERYVAGSILEHCLVEHAGFGSTPTQSGAVECEQSAPFLVATTVRNSGGHGIYAYNARGVVAVVGCVVDSVVDVGIYLRDEWPPFGPGCGWRCVSNSVTNAGYAGVMYALIMRDTTFPVRIEDNSARLCGSGIRISTYGNAPQISARRNAASGCEYGLYVDTIYQAFPLTIDGCVATDNQYGFRLSMTNPTATASVAVQDCVMVKNRLIGGIVGAGLGTGQVSLSRCAIGANGDGTGKGAGLSTNPPSGSLVTSVTVDDCLFFDNRGGSGGGVYAAGSFTARRCTFAGNSAAKGGGLYFDAVGTAALSDCVFLGNAGVLGDDVYAAGSGSANKCRFAGPHLVAHPNQIWDGADAPGLGTVLLSNPGVGDPFAPVGVGLAGVSGKPTLLAAGPLTPGSTATYDLGSAAAGAPALCVLGAAAAYQPAFGGMVVPDLGLAPVAFPLQTDAAGNARLTLANLPALPAGSRVYAQAAVLDSAAPNGLTMTPGSLGVVR